MSGKVKISAFFMQGAASLCIAYLTSLTGFVYAWPSYTYEIYTTNQTVLSKVMTSTQISLLGSLTNIGGLIGTLLCGYVVDKLGRKYSAMLFGLPHVIAWSIISVTTSVNVVLFAIFFAGFGAAGQVITTVYVSEICQDAIRGTMTTSAVYGYFIGLLFSYIIGGRYSYYTVVYIHLLLSVIYIFLLTLLKESPVFLVLKGKEDEYMAEKERKRNTLILTKKRAVKWSERQVVKKIYKLNGGDPKLEAEQSIAFYQRVEVKSKEVEAEMKKIKLQLDPRINLILQGDEDPAAAKELLSKEEEIKEKCISPWKFLMKSESSKRALASVLILMAISILMGPIVLQVYAEPLFKEAIPTMEPNVCSIFLAVDFLVAALVCAIMIDRWGRRVLMTTTSVASVVFNLLLGSQLHLHWAPHWFTAFVIYAYSFVFNFGAAVVPFVLTAEVFLPEVRGLCNSLSMGCMWIINFVTLIIFHPLVESIGLGPTFYVFSIICLVGAMYSNFCLPETKGLSADAIQVLFIKKKKVASKV